jgi:peroxiredoxin Q/BCP
MFEGFLMKIIIFLALIGASFFAYRQWNASGNVPQIGAPAPPFRLADAKLKVHTLADYAGSWLVLYFYPKDDTPGCTKEACHFRDDWVKLEKLGAKVVGVSVDNAGSHEKFAEKYHLPFPLLSDADASVAKSYGALNDLGVAKIAKRYTFLINPEGNIAKVYLKIDTSKHSQEIIDDLNVLKKQ